MTHPKRTIKLTEKVRQAQLDFATPEIRPTKRARVAAPTTPARQTPPALSTPALTRLSSPRALLAASQQGSQPLSRDDAFELELRESQLEGAIVAPTAASRAPTVASANDNSTVGQALAAGFDTRFADNFDDIIWLRLPGYRAPLVPQKHKKSWIYAHGYRINSTAPQLSSKVYFVCKICHLRYHKACSGVYDTTTSPSTAARHLNTTHQIYNPEKPAALASSTTEHTLRSYYKAGGKVPQDVHNALAGFDVQLFRFKAVTWLVEGNHSLSEFERPEFRAMLEAANPEAVAALWTSHNSVSRYVMRLYNFLQPRVAVELSNALSKIHISFDGWTMQGGKRGFLGVVAHFVSSSGELTDLPIALPQLTGAHTGVRIAEVVDQTLRQFGVDSAKLGYFVLDNAANNDTAIAVVAEIYDFLPVHRRLRCGPHTLNLIGQTLLWGNNQQAYDNAPEDLNDEVRLMREWRKDGPLGVLLDVINYIKTPQQHELFINFQHRANADLSAKDRKILEVVKPVVTRWNSYFSCFERAVTLQSAVNAYCQLHVTNTANADAYAAASGNKEPDAQRWMRSGGLTAADWQTVNEYLAMLRPLKLATKRLEGRGTYKRFGSLAEVIPVFETILSSYEERVESYSSVNYNEPSAPEDHIAINLRAAWAKANEYFIKLDDSPAYYAATSLHPAYKHYCDNAWRDKPEWLVAAQSAFQTLWGTYKDNPAPPPAPAAPRARVNNDLNDAIASMMEPHQGVRVSNDLDEYTRWKLEPWVPSVDNPVTYWLSRRRDYPNLTRLALDVLSIPASSCDCERMFSELGDLLRPKRRKISSQLLVAIQSVRAWLRAGFGVEGETVESLLSDEAIDGMYNLGDWHDSEA